MEAASPSLRHCSRPGYPTSQRQPFLFEGANNDDLPHLLVAVLVGYCKYDSVLRSYCQVSKRMCAAANDALAAWLATLTKERDSMLRAERVSEEAFQLRDKDAADQHDRRAAVHMIGAHAMLQNAFGNEFVDQFGRMATTCSVFSPLVYKAMRLRQCALCGRGGRTRSLSSVGCHNVLPTRPHEPSFTFAHMACQRKHCIVLAHDSPIEHLLKLTDEEHEGKWDSCKAHKLMQSDPKYIWKALMVYQLTSRDSFVRSDLWHKLECDRAASHLAHVPGTKGQVHWLRQTNPLVVKQEDTLLGALGVSEETTQSAIDQAWAYLDTLASEKVRIQAERTKVWVKDCEVRRGALLARLGMMHSQGMVPWSTIEEISNVHPASLDRLNITAFIESGACTTSLLGKRHTLTCVASRVVFLAQLCSDLVGKDVLDFMMESDEVWEMPASGGSSAQWTQRAMKSLDFAGFLDRMKPNQVRVNRVSEDWRFRVAISQLGEGTTKRREDWANYPMQADYDSLRRARAYLERLGCTQALPNLLLARETSFDQTIFLNAIIKCALETPLAHGSTTRNARRIAYHLLDMPKLLTQYLGNATAAGVESTHAH
jgi:hypothetical protein